MSHPNPTALVVCAAALLCPQTPIGGQGSTAVTVLPGTQHANWGGRSLETYIASPGKATIDPGHGPRTAATRIRGRLGWHGEVKGLRDGDRVDLIGDNDATIGGSGGDVYIGPRSTVALWHDSLHTTNLVAHYMGATIILGPNQAATIVTP